MDQDQRNTMMIKAHRVEEKEKEKRKQKINTSKP